MISAANLIIENSVRRLKQLKGRYAGKPCAVIGNGPSLRVEDLDQMKGAYTFGVNKIYDLFSMTDWRPYFYVIQDFKMLKAIFAEAEIATRDSHYRFFNSRILDLAQFPILEKPDDFYFYLKNDWDSCPHQPLPSFSDDLSVCAYEGYTVLYSVLQLAVYLGFSRIYLLGVDHNYSVQNGGVMSGLDTKDYFSGFKPLKNVPLNAPRLDRSEAAYFAAKSYCDGHDIQIFNATRGGCLEVFPRISFEQTLEVLAQ